MNNHSNKRKIVPLIIVLLCGVVAIHAQSVDKNYILMRTMQNEEGNAYIDKIGYFDALGRSEQTVLKKASPTQQDIVTLQEYDNIGRESKVWLSTPTAGTGEYIAPTVIKTKAAMFYGDANTYTKPVYEPSPLNRIAKQFGPGQAWHTADKAVNTSYMSNTTNGVLSCAFYTADFSSMLLGLGDYPAGTLFVTQSTDEDGNITYTFTDKQKQLLLTRAMNGSIQHDTYYVYDDLGQLRYVLPPMCTDIDEATLNNYAYKYEYDIRGNCTLKKLPGCDPILMKYDNADRLIFSQDGNQQSKSEWTFYLYDALGREAVIGTCPVQAFASFEGAVVKATYTGGATLGGYQVTPALSGTVNLMTVNYYDNYTYKDILPTAEKTKMAMVTLAGYDNAFPDNTAPNAQGLLTGVRTYQLEDASKYSISALYYDHRGEIVQTHTSNQLGGFEDEYYAYTFTGKVKQKQQVHSAAGKTTQTEVYTYTYDHAERLTAVTHKTNASAAITLAQYTYDEIGRMETKQLHTTTETLAYDYNVRSWLTEIYSSKFNQILAYNKAINGITPTKTLYGGNISAMKWKAGDEASERGYQFTYDGVNRLTNAIYGEGATITANPNRFTENLTYDKMGNITTLQRQGKLDSGYGIMDNLTYDYLGNQLTKVTDAATPAITYPGAFHFVDGANTANEYTYDANGNLTKDLNKNITEIKYNVLNLPKVVIFTNGNTITYTYDGSGNKLSVAYTAGGTTVKTDYVGNKVYKNGTLSMMHTEEGYITFSGATPMYHYYLKDHQGNNRVVMNQNGTVEQVNHYYPFGGLFGEGLQTSNQPYKYNGKELDRFEGLDMFDYGARHYDAAVGRWFTVDPMAEEYYSISPYAYVANNPVKYIDPDGRMPVLLVPLIKGAVGAIADAAAQVTVSMVNGQSFDQAMSSIDYTSVGASFVTAAIAMPGMSTAAKVATVAVVATDATIDVNTKGEIQTIGGVIGENKSITNAAIDAVSSVVPGKVVDNVTSGFNKAVSSDLGSSAAATLTKETKSSMKQAQATVNSTAVQTGANAVADYTGGMIGGQANKAIGTSSTTRISTPPLKDPVVQQNDATRVQRPINPIYSR